MKKLASVWPPKHSSFRILERLSWRDSQKSSNPVTVVKRLGRWPILLVLYAFCHLIEMVSLYASVFSVVKEVGEIYFIVLLCDHNELLHAKCLD